MCYEIHIVKFRIFLCSQKICPCTQTGKATSLRTRCLWIRLPLGAPILLSLPDLMTNGTVGRLKICGFSGFESQGRDQNTPLWSSQIATGNSFRNCLYSGLESQGRHHILCPHNQIGLRNHYL